MKKCLPYILISLMTPFWGCRNIEDEPNDDERISYYLNHQQYESAIALLDTKVIEQPLNNDYKVLLASAYAGAAGINTIECFDILRPRLFDKTADQKTKEHSLSSTNTLLVEEKDKQKDHILAAEQELLRFSKQSTDFLSIAVEIPHIPVEKRFLLVKAIQVLTRIPNSSTQSTVASLYGGIIHIIEFLNYFRDALPQGGLELKERTGQFSVIYCNVDLRVFFKNIGNASQHLQSAFSSFDQASRTSNNPIYANLRIADDSLMTLDQLLQNNQDLADIATTLHDSHKSDYCQ